MDTLHPSRLQCECESQKICQRILPSSILHSLASECVREFLDDKTTMKKKKSSGGGVDHGDTELLKQHLDVEDREVAVACIQCPTTPPNDDVSRLVHICAP